MSGKGFISVEDDSACEYCGTITECRPYGEDGKQICFECAMKPEMKDGVEKRMIKYLGLGE